MFYDNSDHSDNINNILFLSYPILSILVKLILIGQVLGLDTLKYKYILVYLLMGYSIG